MHRDLITKNTTTQNLNLRMNLTQNGKSASCNDKVNLKLSVCSWMCKYDVTRSWHDGVEFKYL